MRILGLDIGSRSVKGVEIDSVFGGRYEVRDYHEVPVPPGSDASVAIEQLLQSLPKAPDRIAVALRTGVVTFRNFDLPAKAKKAIQAAIGFELEDELPFPVDQSIYDFTAVSQTKQTTKVHVAATLKRHLAAFLDLCQQGTADPDLLTTEAWAYRSLLNRITTLQSSDKPALVVHIGHERTILYAHWQGVPVLARELRWGGRDVTAAICKRYSIPLEEAEQAKLDHGFVIPSQQLKDATPEQIEFSETLMQPLQALVRELHQSLLVCKSQTHLPPGIIYTAGGSSLLPGLARMLEENLGIPVSPLQALSSASTSGVAYSEQTDAGFALALATGLCLVGADRAGSINLRKGEFTKQGRSREYNLALLKRVGLAAGAVAATLFLSLFVQSQQYKTQLSQVDKDLQSAIKSFFPQISGSAIQSYLVNTTGLKTAIQKELGRQRDLYKLLGPNTRSPLDFLRELSASIPREIVLDVTQFQVGAAPTASYATAAEPDVTISAVVPNPETADKLASVLGTKITNLQRGKPEEVPGTEPGQKKLKVTFTGKPAEDAYGK